MAAVFGMLKCLIRCLTEVEKLKTIQLRGEREDSKPYFNVSLDLKKIINDRMLWKTVSAIEEKITVFEKLRKAMNNSG